MGQRESGHITEENSLVRELEDALTSVDEARAERILKKALQTLTPLECADKIFREGYSFGETGGTGLGLYLAQKTMERYGGKIRVESTLPHGATFVLSFPRMESFPS